MDKFDVREWKKSQSTKKLLNEATRSYSDVESENALTDLEADLDDLQSDTDAKWYEITKTFAKLRLSGIDQRNLVRQLDALYGKFWSDVTYNVGRARKEGSRAK